MFVIDRCFSCGSAELVSDEFERLLCLTCGADYSGAFADAALDALDALSTLDEPGSLFDPRD